MNLFPPTRDEALVRIAAVQPAEYSRSRNALNGAVTQLSPYITHGFVSLPEVLKGVRSKHQLKPEDKLVFELGWREYYRHVWQHRGDGIFKSLHEGVLPEDAYAHDIPADILQACTGVPAIDMSVKTLYATGYLHNHARMWLASYVVHLRKVHWRVGANWMYGHLLDGDLASNHLSWQWVAGTGSHKPYLFNAENVARFAPSAWHSSGSVIDSTYEKLDQIARSASTVTSSSPAAKSDGIDEPFLFTHPPDSLHLGAPNLASVSGRDVWLVHPWSLGELPKDLSASTVIVGVYVAEFHSAWPWSEKRWQFVNSRMSELTTVCWFGSTSSIVAALKSARQVKGLSEAHVSGYLPAHLMGEITPCLFPQIDRRCDSFAKWWKIVSAGQSLG
jgi:deoxyribodipyrimidine photo-lyase